VDGGRGILRVWTGVITADEVIRATADYYAHENWKKIDYVIADFSGVTQVIGASDSVRDLVKADERISSLIPELAIAVVAPSDLLFGLSRMWEMLNQRIGWKLCVFRTRPEAEAWIKSL